MNCFAVAALSLLSLQAPGPGLRPCRLPPGTVGFCVSVNVRDGYLSVIPNTGRFSPEFQLSNGEAGKAHADGRGVIFGKRHVDVIRSVGKAERKVT